jgi:hypothetical protein
MTDIPTEVHLNIMEYLGYKRVLAIYPPRPPKIAQFVRSNFIEQGVKECEAFSKSLWNANNNIIAEYMSLKAIENYVPMDMYFSILKNILEVDEPSK